MTKKQLAAAIAMSAVAAVAAFVFFGFKYPCHIRYQEQLQLFQFTCAYFGEVCAVPGGFADWCGRFVTQFFMYAKTGAALTALLLVAIQLLTYLNVGKRTLTAYALSFLPAAVTMLYLLDENAIPGAAVAFALSLAGALGVHAIKSEKVRIAVLLCGIPVMYFLCGPLAVIYVLLAVKGEKLWVAGAAVAIAALCPAVSQYIFAYPLSRLFKGIHYHRYPLVLPLWIWIGAASAVLVGYAGLLKLPQGRKDAVCGWSAWAAIAVACGIMVSTSADFHKEELMNYDFMVQHRMWNRLMMTADKKNPDTPMSVSCLNLALAQTGRMENCMFEYFQNGPDGLLPKFVRDCTSPVPTGEIYWHLGMVNTAQRFVFEAQEAIPDFQKSARFYKRLAETNIVNRDYDVARKYIETLENTLFYRSWAKKAERVVRDTTLIGEFPEYVHERELRFKQHDFLFSDTEMDSMLGLLFTENRDNRLAYSYLLAWTLLKKDLPRFVACCSLVNFAIPPQHYQEAILLNWVLTHNSFDGLPINIESRNTARMEEFIRSYNGKCSYEYMQKHFGDTYWFYYYYRNN